MTVTPFCIIESSDVFKYQFICMLVVKNAESSQPFPFYQHMERFDVILSRLVDTFSSRILYPMLLLSVNHSIAVV